MVLRAILPTSVDSLSWKTGFQSLSGKSFLIGYWLYPFLDGKCFASVERSEFCVSMEEEGMIPKFSSIASWVTFSLFSGKADGVRGMMPKSESFLTCCVVVGV